MTGTGGPSLRVPGSRLRWACADGLTLIGRELGHVRRSPGLLAGTIVFPGVMVVLFGYVFGSAIPVPGGGNYREYLMPGLFAMTVVTSIMAVAQQVASDASRGVMDRFRSMPMSRYAVPFGSSGADVLLGVLALAMMVLCGLAVGWRPHQGPGPTAAAFGLLLAMRFALGWVGIWIGLAVRDEQTVDQMLPLIFPMTMISNTFVPTAGMPTWLRAIAEWNPVSALVAACRELFGNPGVPAGGAVWPLSHPVAAVLLWAVVATAVFAPLAVRAYARKGR